MATRSGISASDWQTIWGNTMRDHGRKCHICGKPDADQVDHVIPIGLGGSHTDPANLAPIHKKPCHENKTKLELVEMRRRKQQIKSDLKRSQSS